MATATATKPKISSKSVKEVIEPLLEPGAKNARAKKLRSDWRRFFRDEFALSADQQTHLADIPANVVRQVQQAFGEALDPDKLERLGRYEVHLDRKLERTLASCCASRSSAARLSPADPFGNLGGPGGPGPSWADT